ncbi:hypothetical protein PIB30_044550 [Stylosanthes scabra]|uniref:Uncharacterized protein n=1 Tax=Stylosanthes scabra TaxID=79078 RepID=A0ABU6UGE5_9FABA|nr:hypothetical protein [Stylosanthes scabra]
MSLYQIFALKGQRTEDNWHVTHSEYISRWDTCRECILQGTPLAAPLTSGTGYMKSYRRITPKWIGRSSATLDNVVDLVEQLYLSSSTPPPGFNLDSVHLATSEILATLGEHDRAIHHQFNQLAQPTLMKPPRPIVPNQLWGFRANLEKVSQSLQSVKNTERYRAIARYTVWSCGTTSSRTVNRNAALTLHPRGRAARPCGHAVISIMHPETLLETREVARGDRATARCPVSHFLASSCDPFASNVFLSLSYVFLNP